MKTKTLEDARASAKDIGTLYGFVIDSIEPNITPIDPGAFYASAAISLKRIADALEKNLPEIERMLAAERRT